MTNEPDTANNIEERAKRAATAFVADGDENVKVNWNRCSEKVRERWRRVARADAAAETELRTVLVASENFATVQTEILRKVAKVLRFEADAGGVSLAEHAARVVAERDAAKTEELDESVAYAWAHQALRCLDGSGAELHRQEQALDAVASAVREAWAHRGRTTLEEFPYPMPSAVGIELPYDPRDPDGDCGMARNAMSHVPESYEVAKLLGYCAALVARRDAIAEWRNCFDSGEADDKLHAERVATEDAAREAMARIGDLAPEVVRTLQSERDALKAGIVAFVHGAMPRMPLSLTSAVHGLLALVKS